MRSPLAVLLASLIPLGACGRIGFDELPLGVDQDASSSTTDASTNTTDAQNSSKIIIASGWQHTCAAVDGRVACWGQGVYGQLGQGSDVSSANPVTVALPGPATALAAGEFHSCAVVNGDAYCWGAGVSGALGNGDTQDRYSPTLVINLPNGSVTSIAAARRLSCAVADGVAHCWGINTDGQLGIDVVQTTSTVPVAVMNLPIPVDSIVAASDRACALAGQVGHCWGHDHSGDLGTASNGGWVADTVVTSTSLSQLSLAFSVSCGLIDGGVKCWGLGGAGQLGDGNFSDSTTAVDVLGLGTGVSNIHVAGGRLAADEMDTICAIQSGNVLCWGRNDFGQVGNQGTTTQGSPAAVIGLRGAASFVNGGAAHFCAVTEPNNIECWGRGDEGQLGATNFQNSPTPVLVPLW